VVSAHPRVVAASAWLKALAIDQDHGIVKLFRQPVEQLPEALGRRVWIVAQDGGLLGIGLLLASFLALLLEQVLGVLMTIR